MKKLNDRRSSMGKDTGFLEYNRKDPGYRPVEERIKDYRQVEKSPTETDIREQAARCMDCGVPFCHGYGCPLQNNIPDFNDLVYRGDWKRALDMLLATNCFPEFTGRVCPALCEEACVEGINSQPVTIRQIELAVIEKGFELGLIRPQPPASYSGKRVAVIGAGPSGLAAAQTINRAGHHVTVYDEAESPGGLLRYGIPDFKMEKSVIERRIRLMEAEGIVFEQGVVVGTDISTRYLKKQFDAICLTCGSRQPRDLTVPGRNMTGIFFAMDFLSQQNKRVAGEAIASETEIHAAGKSVIVIGGGDTGSDCIGTALRQGAGEVTQLEILPQPPTERADSTPWPMWPDKLRESHAHKEGGTRLWAVSTQRFMGENGVLKKIRCVRVNWVRQKGRLVPQEIQGSEFELNADIVLLAMGFTGPGNDRLIGSLGLERDRIGNIKTNAGMMTSLDGVFAGGDMQAGQSLVVKAICSGQQVADAVITYLSS